MSRDEKSTTNVQGKTMAILSQREEDFNPREFDLLASKIIAAYAINTGAGGLFCINNGRQQPHGPSLAGVSTVTGGIHLI